jgi:PTH1 family peptidyl-tRNA hydrolase
MLLIAGLGNPGPKYERNRHNIGFMAVDEIVRRHSFGAWRTRFQSMAAEGSIAGQKVMVIKPMTYVNESGRAVGEALRFFKLEPPQVIVIYDELDLKAGKIRAKLGGGNAGHNGLRSIDAHIGNGFWRAYRQRFLAGACRHRPSR